MEEPLGRVCIFEERQETGPQYRPSRKIGHFRHFRGCWGLGISCTLRDFTNLPYHCPIAHSFLEVHSRRVGLHTVPEPRELPLPGWWGGGVGAELPTR